MPAIRATLMASDIAAEVDDIETWDRARCLEAWIAMTGTTPGSRLSARFLRKALIFEAQCKALGGHSAAIKRTLSSGLDRSAQPAKPLATGTQLVREWNGRVYRVDVTTDGFEMDGQSYTSLSAIAKRITGVDWSGPRFFGLKKGKS